MRSKAPFKESHPECRLVLGFGLALVFLTASYVSVACTIPVFRYGLDRWHPDRYTLRISEKDRANPLVESFLRNHGDHDPFNLKISNAASMEPPDSVILFPDGSKPLWSGDLTPDVLSELAQSPQRSEIAQNILSGDSGVWVVIGSGNPVLDSIERQRLDERLRFLEQIAVLPTMDPTDPENKLGPGPELKVRFSSLLLDAGDGRESFFRDMLMRPVQEVHAYEEGPFASLVFGRGRVLGTWPMSQLDSAGIDEACLFLLGACSCQVKALNPGWDLLMKVDWDQGLLEAERSVLSAGNKSESGSPSPVRNHAQSPMGRHAIESVTFDQGFRMEGEGGQGESIHASPVEPERNDHALIFAVFCLLASIVSGFVVRSRA